MVKILQMQQQNIQFLEYGANVSKSIIGLYVQNGVFMEEPHQVGSSYLLDDFIYNGLCDEFSDQIEIRARTCYGYSEWLFICERQEINKVLDKLEKFISEFYITDQTYLRKLQKHTIKKHQKYTPTLKEVFDPLYYNCDRLFQRISGNSHVISKITIEQLNEWFEIYWRKQPYFLCICNPDTEIHLKSKWLSEVRTVDRRILSPICFGHRNENDIVHIAMKRKNTEIICAFDCPEEVTEDPFILEALCLIWESALKNILIEEKIEKVYVDFDYGLTRICFGFFIWKNRLEKFLYNFLSVIRQQPSIELFQNAISETVENIRHFTKDMYQMNQAAGHNYFAGKRYDMSKYEHIEELYKCTYQQILEIQTKIVRREHFSFIYTGERPEVDLIREISRKKLT